MLTSKSSRKILLMNVEAKKLIQISALCQEFGIQIVIVEPSQFGEKIGALAGLPGMELTGTHFFGTAFKEEMMLFVGISQDELDGVLKRYRESGITPIPLKAILTPYNGQWSPVMLHKELVKEHQEFARRGK